MARSVWTARRLPLHLLALLLYLVVVICRACGHQRGSPLCTGCRQTLVAGGERRVGGLLVRSALLHDGAARMLVHHLKYRGLPSSAAVLAAVMEPLLPPAARCLVPVPRVVLRRWRYGVDPAVVLCVALAGRTGLPVDRALRPPLWWPRRAGPAGHHRGRPRFAVARRSPRGAVLVDDVLTTGRTLAAAAAALGSARIAVTATGPAAGRPGR